MTTKIEDLQEKIKFQIADISNNLDKSKRLLEEAYHNLCDLSFAIKKTQAHPEVSEEWVEEQVRSINKRKEELASRTLGRFPSIDGERK